MRAGVKTAPAADAHIRIDSYMVAASVIAVLYRTNRYTRMTIYAAFLIYLDNFRQQFPPLN
jgi:hypothetical protein